MEKSKLYGNGFGQFLLILAEIIGMLGNGYFTYLALSSFGFDKFGDIFANSQTMLSLLLIALPALLTLIAFFITIIGAGARKRGASLTSIILLILAVVIQGAGYVALIADFSAGIAFDAGAPLGKSLSLFAHLGMLGFALFGFIASLCIMGRKKAGSVLFGILALLCGLAAAGLGTFVLFANEYSEPVVLFGYFGTNKFTLLDQIFIAGRFIYVGLFALAMFACAFYRKPVLVEEKAGEPAEEKAKETKAESKKEDKKDDDKKDDDDHHDDGNGGDKNPDIKITNDPFNDRIIIEIR